MPRILQRLSVFILLTSLGLGCSDEGPKLAVVKGKVTYKGEPLKSGTVMFIPVAGGPAATADIQGDGTYQLSTNGRTGALLGDHAVEITVSHKPTLGALPEDEPPPMVNLPARYSNRKTSGLKREVKGGPNEFNFDLN